MKKIFTLTIGMLSSLVLGLTVLDAQEPDSLAIREVPELEDSGQVETDGEEERAKKLSDALKAQADLKEAYYRVGFEDVAIKSWYDGLNVEEDLSVKTEQELSDLLDKYKKAETVLLGSVNYAAVLDEIIKSHSDFLDNMKRLPGAGKGLSSKKFKEIEAKYLNAYNSIDFAWSPEISAEEKREQVAKIQESVKDYFVLNDTLAKSDKEFKKMYRKHKEMLEEYDAITERLKMTWSPKVDVKEMNAIIGARRYDIELYVNTTDDIAAADKEFASQYKKQKAHFENYQTIRNTIDTSYDPAKSIKETEARINALRENFSSYIKALDDADLLHKDIQAKGKPYKKLIASYVTRYTDFDKTWINEESVANIGLIESLQQNVLAYIELLSAQDSRNSEILEKGKKYKNIIAPYKSCFSDYDRTWRDEDSINRIQELSEIQEKIFNILDRENLNDLNKDVRKQKIKTIDELFSYMESI